MLDAGPYLQGKAAGLWADLPIAEIPNLSDTPANLHDPKGVVYTHLLIGLLYDSSKVSPEPTSIANLEDTKFKGKVAVPTFSSTFAFALLDALDEKEGRNGDASRPVDAGFKKMKAIAPNVHSYYGGGAQLVNLFKQGEIELAWGANHVAQGLGVGSPVKWKAPVEGASLSSVYAVIAAGSKNAAAAGKFINIMLSPEFQRLLAEKGGVAYVNMKTSLSDEFKATSPMTVEVINRGKQPKWAIFNKSRIEMNERWQRDLETR
jgi:putative spermidine/putrescine transport system substrate-binding protein